MPRPASGLLVAFEGLDQSGKQTQAERLREHVTRRPRRAGSCRSPTTPRPSATRSRGRCTASATTAPDVMQLLYVANRHEKKPEIERALDGGAVIVCDRYLASSIAYGEAQGWTPRGCGDPALPAAARPDLLLDIAPETAAARKKADRDRYERDLALLSRVRESYHRQAAAGGWVLLDGERPATRCRPTWSGRSRHDSRRGKRAHLARAARAQHPRARLQRRARGATSSTSTTTDRSTSAAPPQRERVPHVAWRCAAGRSVCDGVRACAAARPATAPECRASASA